MKEQFAKFKNTISAAVQSDWFIVLNAALILLGWGLNIWVPMLSVIVVINIIPLFFDRHTKHLFNFLMMFSFIMSTDRNDLMRFAPVLSLVGVLFVGIIFNLVIFKRKFSPLHPKNITGFHASLYGLIFAFAFAGVGSPAEVPLLTVALLALMIILCVLYSFFTVCYYDSEERKELPEYVLKILFASGIIVTIEMIVFYAKIGDVNLIVQAMMEKKVHIGWAGPNNMAPMLSLCVPATLYFCIKKNYATPLFAAIALVEYALIITTGCRGAILFSTLALPPMLLYKSENKIAFGVTVSAIFVVAVILLAYYGDVFANVITTILNKRLDPMGRNELYRLAVDAFKTWPIFGAGWDYKTDLYFHSTFFQVLATMGIFGLVLFAIFYFWRYWTFFKMRKDPAVLALLSGMAIFEAYGFIDTNYFVPNFFIILLFMTFVVEINVPKNTCLAFGGKDPVAQVVGLFRILADRVKPVVKVDDDGANQSNPANPDEPSPSAKNDEEPCAEPPAPQNAEDGQIPDSASADDKRGQ